MVHTPSTKTWTWKVCAQIKSKQSKIEINSSKEGMCREIHFTDLWGIEYRFCNSWSPFFCYLHVVSHKSPHILIVERVQWTPWVWRHFLSPGKHLQHQRGIFFYCVDMGLIYFQLLVSNLREREREILPLLQMPLCFLRSGFLPIHGSGRRQSGPCSGHCAGERVHSAPPQSDWSPPQSHSIKSKTHIQVLLGFIPLLKNCNFSNFN